MKINFANEFDREDALEAVREFVGPLIGMVVMMIFVTGTYSLFIHERFDQLATSVAADIHDPNVSVKLIGHTLILEGTAQDQSERDRCEAIASDSIAAEKAEFSFLAPKVLNLITVKKIRGQAKADRRSGSSAQQIANI